MRITLVKSWSHRDDTTDVDKHGVLRVRQVPTFLSVTTLSGQEILYRSNRAETLKESPRASESINVVAVFFLCKFMGTRKISHKNKRVQVWNTNMAAV